MKAFPPKPVIETESQKEDFEKFFIPEGEPGFDPQRNEYIINKSIEDHERNLSDRKRKMRDNIHERVEALTHYLFSSASELTPIQKYFGKVTFGRLRGEKIRNTLRVNSLGQKIMDLKSLD